VILFLPHFIGSAKVRTFIISTKFFFRNFKVFLRKFEENFEGTIPHFLMGLQS
jgi:hypothetical protein